MVKLGTTWKNPVENANGPNGKLTRGGIFFFNSIFLNFFMLETHSSGASSCFVSIHSCELLNQWIRRDQLRPHAHLILIFLLLLLMNFDCHHDQRPDTLFPLAFDFLSFFCLLQRFSTYSKVETQGSSPKQLHLFKYVLSAFDFEFEWKKTQVYSKLTT